MRCPLCNRNDSSHTSADTGTGLRALTLLLFTFSYGIDDALPEAQCVPEFLSPIFNHIRITTGKRVN